MAKRPKLSKHDETANKLAKKFDTKHNRGKGPDVKTKDLAVEVETKQSLKKDGLRQLQGFRKKVFIAMADDKNVPDALEKTKGTTVGVKDSSGKTIKESTRKRSTKKS